MKQIKIQVPGLENVRKVFHNLPVARLVEQALKNEEGELSANGSLIVSTGNRTGRSPNDRYFVKRAPSCEHIHWGEINLAVEEKIFDRLLGKMDAYLENKDLFVFDGYSGADSEYRVPIRVISPLAWQALFSQTLFVRPTEEELNDFEPEFTIVTTSQMLLEGEKDSINSETFIGIDMERKLILIAGSGYAGEIKKSMFTAMNYLLPQNGVLTMHCSANTGHDGSVALFFGLSGTGKTTLSADPGRHLIGDDEHGWSSNGVFNLEGGCYAKCIHLSPESEPQIFNAISFGSVLENVGFDHETRQVDFDSDIITENTRATYPISHIPDCIVRGMGGHPSDIFLLAADAFGVLPPISRLDTAHAMYHFLSGYTAKLAGTEAGIDEPTATFSACFGEPFMPLHPGHYARMLGERIRKHNVRCWLVNTGWSGGPYGVGERMAIRHTRALLSAALDGQLDNVEYDTHPIFELQMPASCPGVPSEVLNPRQTWSDKKAYDEKAKYLAGLFIDNFKKYEAGVDEEIRKAAPKI